jgi:flagellar motility protein MotE (MotC chaperone)
MSIVLDNRPIPQLVDLGPAAGDKFARTIERARVGHPDEQIITGSTGPNAAKPGEAPKTAAPASPANSAPGKPETEGTRVAPPPAKMPERGQQASSPAERELLEKLRERRGEIDARDRDLEMRDNLLRTTERKLDEKIGQLRTLEGQIEANAATKNDPKQRFRPLVVMYENMKPKEAARVFDRLDIKVLMDLVQQMNPRKVSEILAVMEPAAAERLTVALARQAMNAPETAVPVADGELPRLTTPRR